MGKEKYCIYICIKLSYLAIYLKLTQHSKSAVLPLKNKQNHTVKILKMNSINNVTHKLEFLQNFCVLHIYHW